MLLRLQGVHNRGAFTWQERSDTQISVYFQILVFFVTEKCSNAQLTLDLLWDPNAILTFKSALLEFSSIPHTAENFFLNFFMQPCEYVRNIGVRKRNQPFFH
jgi:hypothetical protein